MRERTGSVVPRQRVLSSPDKLVYPDDGLTKRDIARYYRAVAPLLLPEVVRRPLSLLRCPGGVDGPCFFQKHHAAGLGAHVHAVRLREKSGDRASYLYIDDAAGLLDLVQMNALELHPWGSTVADLEHPDRLVFDLDPGPGVPWRDVVTAARDIRARLQALGLQGFVRLSGGKGLHVVVPVQPGPGWAAVREFCEAFALAMVADAPRRYVATAAKAKRAGLIFIDWLRNARGATSVCNWSLRARTGAGAAVPLAWAALGRSRSGADYPLARAMRRAAKLRGDPWSGWEQARDQPLPRLPARTE